MAKNPAHIEAYLSAYKLDPRYVEAYECASQLAQLQLRSRSTRTTLLYSHIRKYFDLAMREQGWRNRKETVDMAAETFGVKKGIVERALSKTKKKVP
jgi:hypothetical protein